MDTARFTLKFLLFLSLLGLFGLLASRLTSPVTAQVVIDDSATSTPRIDYVRPLDSNSIIQSLRSSATSTDTFVDDVYRDLVLQKLTRIELMLLKLTNE